MAAPVTPDGLINIIKLAIRPKNGDRGPNKWLLAFNETKEAWGLLLEVIRTPGLDDAVGYFAATMLETKIVAEWVTLAAAEKAWLLEGMGEHWTALAAPGAVIPMATKQRAFLSQFCCAMVAAAGQEGPDALAGCLESALAVGGAALTAAPPTGLCAVDDDTTAVNTALSQLSASLSLLRAYGMNVVSRPCKYRAAAAAAAQARLADITALLEAAAVTGEALAGLSTLPSGEGSQSPLPVSVLAAIHLSPLAGLALATASAFVAAGLTLGRLQRLRPGLLGAAMVGIGTGDGSSNDNEMCRDLLVTLMGHAATELETTVQAATLSPSATAATEASAAALAEGAIAPHFQRRHQVDATSTRGWDGGGGGVDVVHVLDVDDVRWTLGGYGTIMNGLAALYPAFQMAVVEGHDAFVKLMADATCALVTAVPRLVVSSGEVGLPVRDILLSCAQHDDIGVMETADEVWPCISDVPSHQRDDAFRAPLFQQVLQCLLRSCAMPPDMPDSGEWEGYAGKLDPDEFATFRDRVVVPALKGCYAELGAQFVAVVSSVAEAAVMGEGGWQAMEAVLFAVRAVANELKSVPRAVRMGFTSAGAGTGAFTSARAVAGGGGGGAGGGGATPATELAGRVDALFSTLFAAMAELSGVFVTVPPVTMAAVKCLHTFAPWLHPRPSLLLGCTQYVAKALMLPAAAPLAAPALRALCTRPLSAGDSGLARGEVVQALLDAVVEALGSGSLGMEDAGHALAAVQALINRLPPGDAGTEEASPQSYTVQLVGVVTDRITATLGDGSALAGWAAAAKTAGLYVATESEAADGGGRGNGVDGALFAGGAGRPSLADVLSTSTDASSTPASQPGDGRSAWQELNAVAADVATSLHALSILVHLLPASDVPLVMEHLAPLFESLVGAFPFSDTVMGAVAVVLSAAASAAGPALPLVITPILDQMAAMCAVFQHGTVLESIAAVVEAADGNSSMRPSEEAWGRFLSALAAALHHILDPVFHAYIRAPTLVQDRPVLFANLFQLGTALLLYTPTLLLPSSHLTTFLQAAQSVLSTFTSHPDLSRAVLTFVARVYYLRSPAILHAATADAVAALLNLQHMTVAEYGALRPALDAAAEPQAGPLAQRMLLAAAEGITPEVVDALSDALVMVVTAFEEAVVPVLRDTFASLPEVVVPGAAPHLTPAACDAMCARALSAARWCMGAPGTEALAPFQAFFQDFLAVCKGHALPSAIIDREYAPLPGIATARTAMSGASGDTAMVG